MTALASFTFRGYTLRPTQTCGENCGCQKFCKDRKTSDEKFAYEWNAADPYHRLDTPAKFWTEQGPGIETYALEDRFGLVLFLRMQRAAGGVVKLHIQFPPTPADLAKRAELRERIVQGMVLGFEWLERVVVLRNVKTLTFESKNPSLIRFCVKRLGFVAEGGGKATKGITQKVA